MSSILEKYAGLVDLLLEKTQAGKIPWSYDNSSKDIKVWNGDVVLMMTRGEDDHGEDLYSIYLINSSGSYLESFNDESLMYLDVPDGKDNYFVRMKNIYNLAIRQATGADRALDEFIDALKKDGLAVPF